jgi:8-oxo-dGTP pyrophosphatase MutT (NUDIX family)
MSAGLSSPRDSRLTVVGSPGRAHIRSAEFVRLSQLRKLSECEQVAAVCYRVRSSGIEFLLVRTRSGGRWTFPKGSAEPGLTHAQAAALEAFEEAGVHGRIEEAAFARYVRRESDSVRKSAGRSGKKLAVNAHLCLVSRLSTPKESERNRTWFSVEDAKCRLGEGRTRSEGTGFARVVDRAVERIQRLSAGTGMVDRRQADRPQQDQSPPHIPQKDALQKVQFESFAEDRGREASFMQHIHRQLGGIRRFAVPMVDAHIRDILQGEVLQFAPAREKKAKALGASTKSG